MFNLYTFLKGLFFEVSDKALNSKYANDTQLKEHLREMRETLRNGNAQYSTFLAKVKSTRYKISRLEKQLELDNASGMTFATQRKAAQESENHKLLDALNRQLSNLSSLMNGREGDLIRDQKTLILQEEVLDKMKSALDKVKSDILNAENRMSELASREAIIVARKETLSYGGIDNSMTNFNDIIGSREETIQEQEFHIDAIEEIAAEQPNIDDILNPKPNKSSVDRWGV